jgi:hypothetical protein
LPSSYIPRAILEPLLDLWCEEEPGAARCLFWHTLPGESQPRRVPDTVGLLGFARWMAGTSPLSLAEQLDFVSHLHDLSTDAGVNTGDAAAAIARALGRL